MQSQGALNRTATVAKTPIYLYIQSFPLEGRIFRPKSAVRFNYFPLALSLLLRRSVNCFVACFGGLQGYQAPSKMGIDQQPVGLGIQSLDNGQLIYRFKSFLRT